MTLIRESAVKADATQQLQKTNFGTVEKNLYQTHADWSIWGGFKAVLLTVTTVGIFEAIYTAGKNYLNSQTFNDVVNDFAKKQVQVLDAEQVKNFGKASDVAAKRQLINARNTVGHLLVGRVADLIKSLPADKAKEIIVAAKFAAQEAVKGQYNDKGATKTVALVNETLAKTLVQERFNDPLQMTGIRKAYDTAAKDFRQMGLFSDETAAKKLLKTEIHAQISSVPQKDLTKRITQVQKDSAQRAAAKIVATNEKANLNKLAGERQKLNQSIDAKNKQIKDLENGIKELEKDLKANKKDQNGLKKPRSSDRDAMKDYQKDRQDLITARRTIEDKILRRGSKIETLKTEILSTIKKRDALTTKIEKIRVLFPAVHQYVGAKQHKIPSKLSPSEAEVRKEVAKQAKADADLLKRLFKKAE